MSAASETVPDAERAWRHTRNLVAFLSFWGAVLLLLAVGGRPNGRVVAIGLPVFLALLGVVLSRTRPDSGAGPGLLRGAGLLCLLYAAGLVLLLLSLAG